MKQTLYDILGVARDASFEDIEVAYARRFEVLRTETSWDSNRLVMLNEAREVLSDAARRAAYDASLDAPTPPPGARHRVVDDREPSGFSAKWIVTVVILAAVVIWWVTRDDAPAEQAASTSVETDEAPAESDSEDSDVVVLQGGDVANVVDQETIKEIDAVTAPMDSTSDAAPQAGVSETAAASSQSEPAATAGAAPTMAANNPLVGNWDCFEPVTGRNSEYGFTADGTLTIKPASGGSQTLNYEMAERQINLTDTDPPRIIDVEELSERKMILNSSGGGQRIVCSR